MKGVWSWADHIQPSIHSAPSYNLRTYSGNPPPPQKKNFQRMKFRHMEKQCLKDEGVDCSSQRTRTLVHSKVP